MFLQTTEKFEREQLRLFAAIITDIRYVMDGHLLLQPAVLLVEPCIPTEVVRSTNSLLVVARLFIPPHKGNSLNRELADNSGGGR